MFKTKRLKRTVLIIGVLALIFFIQKTYFTNDHQWKKNFPKKNDYVDKLPHPDSLFIFLMAGQSNMVGLGFIEARDTIANHRILSINHSMNWIYGKEPIHFYEKKYIGLDCGLSFASKIIDSIPEGFSVAIIPCAVGGSSIQNWINNDTIRGVPLLDNLKNKINFSKKFGKIKGVIWHQGESDATQELIPKYQNSLISMINLFRDFTNNDSLPIVLGELGNFINLKERQEKWNSINDILNNIAKMDNNIEVIKTKEFTFNSDNLHFDSKSQRELGVKFALKHLQFTSFKKDLVH